MKHIIKASLQASTTPELICITHLQAAQMLGVEKRTVSNQISRKD